MFAIFLLDKKKIAAGSIAIFWGHMSYQSTLLAWVKFQSFYIKPIRIHAKPRNRSGFFG